MKRIIRLMIAAAVVVALVWSLTQRDHTTPFQVAVYMVNIGAWFYLFVDDLLLRS